MSGRRILFIALEFAPVQTTGAFRSIKFVKYLRQFGIEPVVVTIEPSEGSKIFSGPINPKLLEDIPDATEIIHLTATGKMFSAHKTMRALRLWTSFNDGYYRRYRDSLQSAIDRALASGPVHAVYASLPPFGAGMLALDASRRMSVPMLIDMRDAWSQVCIGPFPSYVHYLTTLAEEGKVLGSADRIVTVTPQLSAQFLRVQPKLKPEQMVVLPNGYDHAQAAPITASASSSSPSDETFDVAYVGSYYYDPRYAQSVAWYRTPPHRWLHYKPSNYSWLHRSPEFFFRAWAKLKEIKPQIASRLRYHHIGSTPNWLKDMAARHGVQDACIFHGFVAFQQLPMILNDMDAFLCTAGKPEVGPDYCLASKTFDYLAYGKPLIGFVGEGAQRDFLAKCGLGKIATPDTTEEGVALLEDVLTRKQCVQLDTGYLAQFDRELIAGQLAETLRALVPNED